jgi:hypothetical protein
MQRKLLSTYDGSNELQFGAADSLFQPDRPMSPLPICKFTKAQQLLVKNHIHPFQTTKYDFMFAG